MSNYSRGANFERRVRKHLEEQGWVVFRSAGSHSPADLIALKTGEVMLVQCQLDKGFSLAKRNQLAFLGLELNVQTYLAWREGKVIMMERIW